MRMLIRLSHRFSVLTNEHIILNYHGVDFNPAIIIICGEWLYGQPKGLMCCDMWDPSNYGVGVGSRLINEPGYLFGLSLD